MKVNMIMTSDNKLKIGNGNTGNTVSEDALVSSKKLVYKPYGPTKLRFCFSSCGNNMLTIQMVAVLNVSWTFLYILIFKSFRYVN
jgi:hypothetical protein